MLARLVPGLGLFFLTALFPAAAADPEVAPSDLPRVPPTEPGRAPATFRVKPGFRFDLVAAEPMVTDPIAMSFDADGRLYVVEMRDYSERRPERLGCIRLLEDTNQDGRFDRSTLFATNLPWPTAVICCEDGVFVGATPEILFLKDTTGDGVADVREVIFTGFASDYAPFETNRLNVQALLNSFAWSLDNRIHGATSFSGGNVQLTDSPFTRAWRERPRRTSPGALATGAGAALPKPVNLRGRDFSFDPRTLELRAESGGGQHGLSFDNRGRKYVCSNSSHLQTVLYEDRYAARNPFYAMPPALEAVAVDGPAAPVFRLSPDEPWRVIRTRWRVSGLVPGPIEGGGRPSGYFTGATGVTAYRGNAFPEEMVGDIFVADCGSNLIHHKKIRPAGFSVRAERAADEQTVEFVASTDNWFRPVQFANAPDGTLYVCDMYREVIEHPWSLPPTLKKHLDLNSGNDRGRIYRIAPAKFKQPKPPRLSRAGTTELVRTLAHGNGWHRDTAARLLCERNEAAAIPALRNLATESKSDLGRLHAFCVLDSLGALKEADLRAALNDGSPTVRRQAVRGSETFLRRSPSALLDPVARLGGDPDPEVRLQVAFSLGESREPARLDGFLRIIRHREPGSGPAAAPVWDLEDPLLRAALASSLEDDAAGMFTADALRSFPGGAAVATRQFLASLAETIGAHNRQAEVNRVLDFVGALLDNPANSARRDLQVDAIAVAAALGDGLLKAGATLAAADAQSQIRVLFATARQLLGQSNSPAEVRLGATLLLAHDNGNSDTLAALFGLLPADGAEDVAATPSLQKAALTALGQLRSGDVATGLVKRWPQLTPELRVRALQILLSRAERVRTLLKAVEAGTINQSELNANQVQQLREHKDPALREVARRLLAGTAAGTRSDLFDSYLPALQLTGNAAHGQKIFVDRCALCHRLGNQGQNVGPDLATVKAAGKEKLLSNVLDPNREVNPLYASYLIETRDGESWSGLIANESASSVTMRQPAGTDVSILRANIVSLRTQGKSLMPEGLEAGLSAQDMADLLEYVLAP